MAADLQKVERVISGKGEIRIPEEYRNAKSIFLYTQVIRDVQTPSRNLTFNPYKSFFAHINFCYGDFVLQTFDCNFDQQVWQIYDGMSAQILVSMKCFAQAVLNDCPIRDHSHNIYIPDNMKFVCYANVALKITLQGQKLDLCNETDSVPNPPPAPPFSGAKSFF